jgi:hypothetical protein
LLVLLVVTALVLVPVLVPVWRLVAPDPTTGSAGGLPALLAALARTLRVTPRSPR